jgi:hypothetical protein
VVWLVAGLAACGDRAVVGTDLAAVDQRVDWRIEPACPQGLSRCGGACVHTGSDPNHCGGCGRACGTGLECHDGVCGTGSDWPKIVCDGAVIDPTSDNQNCGGCGLACEVTKGFVCVAGTCSCVSGMNNCNGTCRNLQSDPLACGSCTTTCAVGTVCSAGTCSCVCPTGQICCGVATLYCTNPASDPKNCGGCGNTCMAGETCVNGKCMTP